MRWTRVLGALAAIAAGAAPSFAGTVHVNGTCGDDSWSGASAVCASPDGPKATIQAAVDAALPGDMVLVADGTYSGPGNIGIDLLGKAITVRSAGGPAACRIDAQHAGRGFKLVSGETTATVIEGFTITNGLAIVGGGILVDNGSGLTLRNCTLTENEAEGGGAVFHRVGGSLVLEGCRFRDNVAGGVAGVLCYADSLTIVNCQFTDNIATAAIGSLVVGSGEAAIVNCSFLRNAGAFVAGGVLLGDCVPLLANCVFSGNTAERGGGVYVAGPPPASFVNCTWTLNDLSAIRSEGYNFYVTNSIIWDNDGSIFVQGHGDVTVFNSDVQGGGFSGNGNISADPLFVQPGLSDLRLSIGSPCLDAGSTASLPQDLADLDGDANTTEPLPLDRAGMPRVQGTAVDMGAYEGAYDAKPAAAGDDDLDQGDSAVLVPEGTTFNPLQSPAVIFMNVSGGADAAVTATQWDLDLHPDAGGFTNLGLTIALETTLIDGTYVATVFMPFDAEDLDGTGPLHVDVTALDQASNTWALATWANTIPSPGHAGPIGDRNAVTGPGGWGVTGEPGDFGVYWDPSGQDGFAWAVVDRVADFGLGVARCPADCHQAPDGEVAIVDLLMLLARWGAESGGGPCDVDYDGVIGTADVLAFLDHWGPCAEAASATTPPQAATKHVAGRVPDLDRSGRVGTEDVRALLECWGACEPGCHADLDGDRVVSARDLLALLASWGLPAD